MKFKPGQVIVVYFYDTVDAGILIEDYNPKKDDEVRYLSFNEEKVVSTNGAYVEVSHPHLNAIYEMAKALAIKKAEAVKTEA
jgi:hypothetical protein